MEDPFIPLYGAYSWLYKLVLALAVLAAVKLLARWFRVSVQRKKDRPS